MERAVNRSRLFKNRQALGGGVLFNGAHFVFNLYVLFRTILSHRAPEAGGGAKECPGTRKNKVSLPPSSFFSV